MTPTQKDLVDTYPEIFIELMNAKVDLVLLKSAISLIYLGKKKLEEKFPDLNSIEAREVDLGAQDVCVYLIGTAKDKIKNINASAELLHLTQYENSTTEDIFNTMELVSKELIPLSNSIDVIKSSILN